MSGFAIVRIVQTAAYAGAFLLTSCADAKEPARPSIIPELAEMQPLFACMESAPLGSKAEAELCAKSAGISINELPNEPKKAAEFKPLIVATWFYFDQDKTKRLSSSSVPSMIEYAKCVETHAYADKAFSSRMKSGVLDAKQRAEFACMAHPLSMLPLNREAAGNTSDMRERMLAKLMANAAFNYALEENGWFPNEMRPCIKYLDGRPPSIGCSLNPQPKIKAPPPPTGYRPQ